MSENENAGSQSAVLATKATLRGSSPCVAPATKSANEPHLHKSRFTAPVTKSELVEDHHRVQSAVPATKSTFRSKTAPIPCAAKMRAAPQQERSRQKRPPRPRRFCECAQSKSISRMSRDMNLLENSSELAVDVGDLCISCFTPTKCVHTVWRKICK